MQLQYFSILLSSFYILLTTLWVLQSCPLIVRSSLKRSLLITSILQVSDRPRA